MYDHDGKHPPVTGLYSRVHDVTQIADVVGKHASLMHLEHDFNMFNIYL